MRNFWLGVVALVALVLSTSSVLAQTVTYTFDSGQWVSGSSSPYVDMAPDSGNTVPGFRTSFTSSPNISAFGVGALPVNPLFSGLSLYQGGMGSGNILTITLSRPIQSVHLDFAQVAPGHLDFTCAAGSVSVATETQSGILDFQGSAPFSEFSLASFYGTMPIPLGIDNLFMTVPEPSGVGLMGVGLGLLAYLRRGCR